MIHQCLHPQSPESPFTNDHLLNHRGVKGMDRESHLHEIYLEKYVPMHLDIVSEQHFMGLLIKIGSGGCNAQQKG